MICPVELASEMSAFWRGPEVELPAGGRHGFLLGVRHGAGDEDTGSDFASDGEKDHLEPGRRDHRHQRPADAPLVRAPPGVWLRRAIRPPIAQAESEARAGGGSRASAGTVPGHVFRSERSALLRKAARGARYRPELYLGQAGLARGWSGEEGASARRSSPATTAAAVAGNAVAFGWQPAPLVWRRSLV